VIARIKANAKIGRRAAACACLFLALTSGCTTREAKTKSDLEAVRRESSSDHLRESGELSARMGDMTRAEQYYVAAIKAGGNEKELTDKLLVVCSADGRYPAASEYAENYLRNHPTDTDIRYAAAVIQAAVGDAGRARSELERVLDERPNLAEAHYALATVLREAGDAPLAADFHYREYLRLSPRGTYAEAARSLLMKTVP
jgi:Flp pilus assembly protein TadD